MAICAGEYEGYAERFAPGAFDSQVGKRVPVKIGDFSLGSATVTAVEISDDGRTAWLELDMATG